MDRMAIQQKSRCAQSRCGWSFAYSHPVLKKINTANQPVVHTLHAAVDTTSRYCAISRSPSCKQKALFGYE